MRCVDILIQLALWTTAVKAFYPYFPSYICSEDNICETQKRTLPVSKLGASLVKDDEPAEPVTFKLSQRFHSKNAASSLNAAREADRLRRKHASSDSLTDRDNTYTVMTATTPTEPDSVGIDQDGTDFSYFIQADVGSSGKSLYMLIDTGAGTSWVMGSDCDSTACGMHTLWASSDTKTVGDGFSIAYGSGAVAGALAEDSISISSLKVTMTFGVANTTSDDFVHFPFDGILGLSQNLGATDNFIGSIKSDKLLSSNIFSVDLNRASEGTNTGSITFGSTDPTKYTGDISYATVDSSAGGDWAVPMGDMAYNGVKAGITGRLAYIDTGTTFVFGPTDDVAAIHKAIPGASSTDGLTYTAPCKSTLPITISFSGVIYTISAKDWLSAPSSSGVCTSNIYGHEIVAGAWLLGDLFLKNVYTVFDADQSRIGFASKSTVATTTSSTQAAASASETTSGTASVTDTATTATSEGSSLATTITAQPSTSSGSASMPGLSGHETSAGTAVADTTSAVSASASPTQNVSPGEQLESNRYVSILCVVAVIVFAA